MRTPGPRPQNLAHTAAEPMNPHMSHRHPQTGPRGRAGSMGECSAAAVSTPTACSCRVSRGQGAPASPQLAARLHAQAGAGGRICAL